VKQPTAVDPWVWPLYLDTSAFVKLFVDEPESDALNAELSAVGAVVLSDLTMTELASALARRVREQVLTIVEARRLYGHAEQVVASCRLVESTPPVQRRAARLLLTSKHVPLRTLDAIHLALAIEADVATLVTFDPRLREAAGAQGLYTAPA
jgi:uncharacterized protein